MILRQAQASLLEQRNFTSREKCQDISEKCSKSQSFKAGQEYVAGFEDGEAKWTQKDENTSNRQLEAKLSISLFLGTEFFHLDGAQECILSPNLQMIVQGS